MNESDLESRLVAAFGDVRTTVQGAPDLFVRVTRTLAEAQARRRFRLRLAAGLAGFVFANVALALGFSDFDNRRFHMEWWVIELITNIVLVALAIGLGPFIKRFGRSYAADVFRANPRTGKSYLVLTDVAYYLVFTSFILFTVTFEERAGWRGATGVQLKDEVSRVGGMLLIMGILHAANVVALPVIGHLLASNRRPDQSERTSATPPIGPGTWILRVEPASAEAANEPPSGPER